MTWHPAGTSAEAAANLAELPVHPRPRVTVVSTGDELVAPGSALAHGQIVDSNHVMLRALVEAAGAEVAAGVHLRDEVDAVRALVDAPPGSPDLVITSGGVSMGVYDTVKEVLSADGGVDFVKVALRPGMPQGSGLLGAHRARALYGMARLENRRSDRPRTLRSSQRQGRTEERH